MVDNKREKSIIAVTYITLVGNAILAILKLTAGFLSNSFAVIGDGIDSSTDVIISIIALISAYIALKPPDRIHTFGHKRAETIGTKILSFIILFAGLQLLTTSVGKIFSGGGENVPGFFTVIIIIISIISKLLLSMLNFNIGKRVKSDLIIANAKNMRNDIVTSTGVLLGLIFTIFFKLPILDPIIAVLVSIWVLRTGFDIFIETSNELMDGVTDKDIYNKLFEVVKEFSEVRNPHKVRARKLGDFYTIELDIEVEPSMTVKESHDLATRLEESLKSQIENIYDVIIHTEPYGNIHNNELYGVNENNIN